MADSKGKLNSATVFFFFSLKFTIDFLGNEKAQVGNGGL